MVFGRIDGILPSIHLMRSSDKHFAIIAKTQFSLGEDYHNNCSFFRKKTITVKNSFLQKRSKTAIYFSPFPRYAKIYSSRTLFNFSFAPFHLLNPFNVNFPLSVFSLHVFLFFLFPLSNFSPQNDIV
jgi:hypothetical protein